MIRLRHPSPQNGCRAGSRRVGWIFRGVVLAPVLIGRRSSLSSGSIDGAHDLGIADLGRHLDEGRRSSVFKSSSPPKSRIQPQFYISRSSSPTT
jgi:hypothetical protein